MAYATAANMIERYDSRVLGDLCADDNTRVSTGSLPTNPRLIACLIDAEKEINLALKQADRYTADQLAVLAATPDYSLIRLTCDICLGLLYTARGRGIADYHTVVVDKAWERVEDLRSGKWVLPVATAINAGLPDLIQPTIYQRAELNSATGIPFFPVQPVPGYSVS